MKSANSYRKHLYIIMMILSIIPIFFSITSIALWIKDTYKINQLSKKLKEYRYDDVINNNQSILVNPPMNNLNDSYWDYIDTPFLNIDFTDLKRENNDTVAWIQVMGTNVDYPVVQTTDNRFYLLHTFDKSFNKAGWIFSDYRNNFKTLNFNSIIYGHGLLNDTMFGSLNKTLTDDWFQNKKNHIIKLTTLDSNMIFQIFSVYTIQKESYYITTYFQNSEKYLSFLKTIQKRSIFPFQTSLNTNDRILTLSTCKDDYGKRIVIHAKLIKRETKV